MMTRKKKRDGPHFKRGQRVQVEGRGPLWWVQRETDSGVIVRRGNNRAVYPVVALVHREKKRTNKTIPVSSFKPGDEVRHFRGAGIGVVLDITGSVVRVQWRGACGPISRHDTTSLRSAHSSAN